MTGTIAPPPAELQDRLALIERAIRAKNWKTVASDNQAILVDELTAFMSSLATMAHDSKLVSITARTLVYAKKTWTMQNARNMATLIDTLLVEISFRWPKRGTTP
ncbi:MAG: hypothetical protein H7099_11660 [Gemmatimonadaceae bacterium]|nr:hypothetical protein [Gemmatimonadaceae bacterium]